MRIWFKNLSRFGQIGVVVFVLHTALILALLIHHGLKEKPPLRKPIAIRTKVEPMPPKTAFSTTSGIIGKKAKEVVSKGKPPVQEVKKATSKVTPAKKQEKKRQESSVDSRLLEQIAEGLSAIAEPVKTSKPSHFAPTLPPSIELHAKGRGLKEHPRYGEIVMAILQSSLDLPEFGQVVVKIEINASGDVTQCEILDARSRKNAEFLKKRLQELTFPCFNEFGLSENHLDFTVTFHNVENR